MGKGSHDKGTRDRTQLEAEGLFRVDQQLGDDRHRRSKESRGLHSPRPLPHQDQDKAGDEGMREDDVWQGDQGESKASEDNRESLPSCSFEETDLRKYSEAASSVFPEGRLLWESHRAGLGGTAFALGHLMILSQCVHVCQVL